jgi:uncharacterized protein (DUF2236 family)
MAAMLESDELAVAPCAREMAGFLFGRAQGPRAASQPPLGRFAEALTAAMLPLRFVRELGLVDSRWSRARVRVAVAAVGPVYRRMPRVLVSLPAHSAAHRRLAGKGPSRVAAWTERQLFGLARKTAAPAG